MTDTVFVMTVLASALAFLSLYLLTGFLWKRLQRTEAFTHEHLRRVEHLVDELEAKVPESRLQTMESTIEAFRTRIDAATIENETYREQVHKSMQRFNAIMRRNERALPARRDSTDPEDDGIPDEIPLGDVRPSDHHRTRPSRAELRELSRKKEQQK